MGGLSGLMAVAVRLATAARGGGDGTGAKVAKLRDLLSDRLPTLLQFGKGMRHEGPPFPERVIYARKMGTKKERKKGTPSTRYSCVARPSVAIGGVRFDSGAGDLVKC